MTIRPFGHYTHGPGSPGSAILLADWNAERRSGRAFPIAKRGNNEKSSTPHPWRFGGLAQFLDLSSNLAVSYDRERDRHCLILAWRSRSPSLMVSLNVWRLPYQDLLMVPQPAGRPSCGV